MKSERKTNPPRQYQFRAQLRAVTPAVWRRFVLPGHLPLRRLHEALQCVFDWHDQHPHHFKIGDEFYSLALDLEEDADLLDEVSFRLDQVFRRSPMRAVYAYDFADGWAVDLVLEKITAGAAARPACLAGAEAAPPDGCGGPEGWDELRAALDDPAHPAHAEYAARYDAEAVRRPFDPASVAERFAAFA